MILMPISLNVAAIFCKMKQKYSSKCSQEGHGHGIFEKLGFVHHQIILKQTDLTSSAFDSLFLHTVSNK